MLQNKALDTWNSQIQKSGFPKMHHYAGFSQIRSQLWKYCILHALIRFFVFQSVVASIIDENNLNAEVSDLIENIGVINWLQYCRCWIFCIC